MESRNFFQGPTAVVAGNGNVQNNYFGSAEDASQSRHLANYLAAAQRFGHEQPYPGVFAGPTPPLASVYVRQHAVTHGTDLNSRARASSVVRSTSSDIFPAEIVLDSESDCFILSGPGGGKTSLLRSWLASGAARWLEQDHDEDAVPVLVSAASLVGVPLAQGLAAAVTADLAPWLLEEIPSSFFSAPPAEGAFWLVLVDGLDEISETAARQQLLESLFARGEGEHSGQYRFVIATRPLPEGEIEAAFRAPRYDLEPFDLGDLEKVAINWFKARRLPDPEALAQRFLQALKATRIDDLARVPLMASLLCQLHAEAPDDPLPAGREEIYRRFTGMLHQRQHADHSPGKPRELCAAMVRYGSDASQKAETLLNHLPQIISFLAAQWNSGRAILAIDAVQSHPLAGKPLRAPREEWLAFLESCLRNCGLLTVRSGDYSFLHQTLLEYLAARHVADDPAHSRHIFRKSIKRLPGRSVVYISGRRGFMSQNVTPSFLGFLVDISAERQRATSESFLARLASRGGIRGCRFILDQLQMGTIVPLRVIAAAGDYLERRAKRRRMAGEPRIAAARLLLAFGDSRGIAVLDEIIRTANLDYVYRQLAIQELLRVGDVRVLDCLDYIARDKSLSDGQRHGAISELANSENQRSLELLHDLAGSRLGHDLRHHAIRGLCSGKSVPSASFLYGIATNPSIGRCCRFESIRGLAGVGGQEARDLLNELCESPSIAHFYRVEAAHNLLLAHDMRAPGVLFRLAIDRAEEDDSRMEAGKLLARAGDSRSNKVLLDLADDESLSPYYRKQAVRELRLMGDQGLPDVLWGWARDGDRSLARRLEAAGILQDLGDGRAVDVLAEINRSLPERRPEERNDG